MNGRDVQEQPVLVLLQRRGEGAQRARRVRPRGRSRRPTARWASLDTEIRVEPRGRPAMPKTYKWSDRHIFSDRFMMEAQYAHVGNNFTLDLPRSRPCATCSRATTRSPGAYGAVVPGRRSTSARPTASTSPATTSRRASSAATTRSSSAFKVPQRHRASARALRRRRLRACARTAHPIEAQHLPRRADRVRPAEPQPSTSRTPTAEEADGQRRRPLRLPDRLRERRPTVAASPFYGQATYAGVYKGVTYTGAAFDQLPAGAVHRRRRSTRRHLERTSPRASASLRPDRQREERREVNYARYVGPARHRGHCRAPTTPVS